MTSKILIVDDEPRVSRLVTEVLTAVGYQVVVAASGGMAIQMVALEQPDLVLLDILLCAAACVSSLTCRSSC